MHNPWKLATIGLTLMGTTALGTGMTTAYLVRPAAEPGDAETSVRPAVLRTAQLAPPAHPAVRPAAARPAPVVSPPPAPSVAPPAPPRVTPVATPVASAPADCATGTDRAMRIAKPGLVGTLLGAGLGAAGGAIADGGKGAGKGALIGGLAGAALGTGYGAYRTQDECGTIFGGESAPAGLVAPPAATPPAALHDGRGGITVYNAR
jgi:hypothetical protein